MKVGLLVGKSLFNSETSKKKKKTYMQLKVSLI